MDHGIPRPVDRISDLPAATLDPLTISGMISVFEAETGVYTDSARTTLATTSGDGVASWTDQKAAYHAEKCDDVMGTRPTYQTSVINGLPVIQCDSGFGQFLLGNTNLGITGSHAFSMSFTFKLLGTTQYGTLMGIGYNNGDPTQCYIQQNSNTNTLFVNANSAGYNTHLTAASGKNFTTGFHVCTVTYDGTNLKYYIDSTLIQTVTIPFNITDHQIGFFGAEGSQMGDNQMQCAFLTNTLLSDTDRAALENYQSQKCGGLF
jgi:hypothetical protein